MKPQLLHHRSLIPDPENPRVIGGMGDIEGLAQSIRVNGLLEPLLVKPIPGGTYLIIAGHRRHAACKLARLDLIPCLIQAGTLSPSKVRILRAVENLQREQLHPVDEARAFDVLLRSGLSQNELAAMVGKSGQYVSSRLYLLQLDEETQRKVAEGLIPVTVAINAVRSSRQRRGLSDTREKVVWQPDHLVPRHPLAEQARTRCKDLHHTDRRKVTGSGACGECWEVTIRADERARFTQWRSEAVAAGELSPAPA